MISDHRSEERILNKQIKQLEAQYQDIAKRLSEARKSAEGENVAVYEFADASGTKKLSELFGDKKELILIHNMGKSCRYCTLWADGFNGLVPHLENAASLVVASPDAPEVQAEFAESRGWKFNMVSYTDSFPADMGVKTEDGGFEPGVSGFVKGSDGMIKRTGFACFGPGDQFCSLWHMLDLLGTSHKEWSPKYRY